MLKAFRDNLKRLMWILWVVIAAFVLLVFVDFGGAGYRRQAQTDSTAATVGGENISLDDFRRQYQQSERQAQAIYGANYTPELGRQLGIAVQALDGLIAKHILTVEAERLGLAVSAEELRAAILEIPGFENETGAFIGEDEYQQTLRANGFTVGDFERELRSQLLVQKLRDVLAQTLYVTDQEIESSYRDQVERASIRYVQVDAGRFTGAPAPTPADLDAYFQAHRTDFRIPERRSVDFLIVEPRLLRSTIQLEEAELRAYYDSNIAEFTDEQQVRARHILLTADGPEAVTAAKAKIEDFKRRIAGGEDFAALARQYSQDETTKDRGGELGFFGRGRYNPQLEEAAFAGKPGDLVGPIESDLLNQTGLDLVQILDRREGGVADFESVRPRIQSRLLNDRSQAAAENAAKELARQDQGRQAHHRRRNAGPGAGPRRCRVRERGAVHARRQRPRLRSRDARSPPRRSSSSAARSRSRSRWRADGSSSASPASRRLDCPSWPRSSRKCATRCRSRRRRRPRWPR